ncbi:MAG: ATP-binding protein [Deltaproteobacteria bacterium]|nr:ATP-binding protein [Deltaproteobacteria bacterium]
MVGHGFEYAGRVSNEIKKILLEQGIPEGIVRRVAVVIFEVEVNIISYAETGFIRYQVLPDSIIIEAKDKGQGIADIELAQQEGYSTADDKIREMGFGAGMGLANIKKFSDVFEINSEVGKGTYVKSIINIDKKRS